MKQEKTQDTTTEEHIKKGFALDEIEQQEFLRLREPRNITEVKTK